MPGPDATSSGLIFVLLQDSSWCSYILFRRMILAEIDFRVPMRRHYQHCISFTYGIAKHRLQTSAKYKRDGPRFEGARRQLHLVLPYPRCVSWEAIELVLEQDIDRLVSMF